MTMPPAAPRQCFAASNSREGFKNYYGEIFTDARIDRLHIIKGGPGTGKSHFMKVVARRARERGYAVTEFYCSSDPASLDGIILTRKDTPTVGLLDGTAPHVREPALPGAKDEIVNLGAFWDPKALTGQRDTIRRLGQGKSAAYARAYTCLRAAGEMADLTDSLTEDCVRPDRPEALAARILRHQPTGESFDPIPALRNAMGMTGKHTLHSFEEAAKTLILPEDPYGMGYRLTAALLKLSESRRHKVFVSYDPLCPHRIDGLLYPDTGLCVLVGDASPTEGAAAHALSLRRYYDSEKLRAVRGELRHAITLRETLTATALRHLAGAATHHFELEKIYAAAMDFRAKEVFTERFCEDALGK
ncbi:MAG: hypothetical protein J6B24_01840 [Clostridia bacterium]|nr:hypothetical protein [Clostridia bacterium]